MTLDYTIRDQVKINMFDYVDEILSAFDKAESTTTSKNVRNDDNL
jgi:Cu/Ag efflux protein CusF